MGNRYGVVDPSGKVMRTWFTDINIEMLSKEVGISINPKSTNKINSFIARLENMGFVIVLYGKIDDKNVKVPINDLYEEWEYIQREYC